MKLSELHQQGDSQASAADLASSLRQYLYEKYVYRGHPIHNEMRALETLGLAVAGVNHE